METDVGVHIADVLFERDNVSIPGLGAFDTHYREAASDQVQGKVLPPAKELTFSRPADQEDSFLIKYIKEKNSIAYSDAQKMVKDFVSDVHQAVEEKEMVVLPNVGRLYKDFEEQLQFLPDKENFNKSTFGLPAVATLPPVRALVPQEPVVEPKAGKPGLSGPVARWFARNVISIAAISITLIAFALYNIYFQGVIGNNGDVIRINESPSNSVGIPEDVNEKKPVEAPVIGFNKAPENLPASGEAGNEAADRPSPYEAIAGNIPQPKPYTAIIRVGTFSLSIHADRMARTLRKEGFKPLTKRIGKDAVVAVEIGYENEDEIPSIIDNLKKKFVHDDVRLLEKKSNEL